MILTQKIEIPSGKGEQAAVRRMEPAKVVIDSVLLKDHGQEICDIQRPV
ncbi:hypothetical protein [Arthrobacter sp. STN4]|nr:hypothetical protein [Arthrobacter sp. STN4]MCQ9164144.1 hypothetical protein [Arthrobacter sp. STN4]